MRYARVAGVSLAYQTWGAGPATIIAIPPLAQNIELTWERPEYRTMLERLGAFARVLHFDKRGTGASDRAARLPTMDERVEDLRAVMAHAGIRRAHLLGVSEGGPMALALAATYPDLVDGVILMSSGARIHGDVTPEELAEIREWSGMFADRWGTEETVTLDVFAPSLASNQSYRAWEPRYERQSATPAAMRELLEMIEMIDVRPLLASVTAPILALHRRDDRVISIDRSREVVSASPSARLVELDGDDHMAQAGDVHAWLDHVEAFTTGSLSERTSPTHRHHGRAVIKTMGGFAVRVGGEEVAPTAWGSRRARQLVKRLAVAAGQPVPRDLLIEMLWPDELDANRLGARLSVLLSNIRRVLGGGLVADRAAVALDVATVDLDLRTIHDALARGDDTTAVEAYGGVVLPEDAYEDWATEAREHLERAVIGAHRRLANASAGRIDDVERHAAAIIELDQFDEWAHELLVRTLAAAGRPGDAARADDRYRQRMAELGVRPQQLLDRRATTES